MTAVRWCASLLLSVVLLRLAWAAAGDTPLAAAAAGTLWPLLPFAAAFAFRMRGMWLYGGIAAGIWFCHGVMEAWATPGALAWGIVEALLSAGYFVAYWRRALALRAAAALRGPQD